MHDLMKTFTVTLEFPDKFNLQTTAGVGNILQYPHFNLDVLVPEGGHRVARSKAVIRPVSSRRFEIDFEYE